MILERTPQPENLIASEIVKCEHSVAIKRGMAIERLCLDSLKPKRITAWKFLGPAEKKKASSSEKAPTGKKGFVYRKTRHRKRGHGPKLLSKMM